MSCTHHTELFGPVMNEQTHKTPARREPEFVNNVEIAGISAEPDMLNATSDDDDDILTARAASMTFLKTCLAFADAEPASGKQAESAAALPPVGSHTLVTDPLASPGHFVLYHFLATAVTAKAKVSPGTPGHSCIYLPSVMKCLAD